MTPKNPLDSRDKVLEIASQFLRVADLSSAAKRSRIYDLNRGEDIMETDNEKNERFVDWTPLDDSPHQLSSGQAGPPEAGSIDSPQASTTQEEERRAGNRRGSVVDRRLGLDRRRGPGRRRGEDRKSAEEGQMSDEQFEFLMAIDSYKKQNARPFPTWTEVLEVIKALGYRKIAEPSALAECAKNAEGSE